MFLKQSIVIVVFFTLLFSLTVLATEKSSENGGDIDSINIEDDQEIINLKKEIEEKNKEDYSKVVSSTIYFLNGEKTDVRTSETNLGNLIADAILANIEADLAFINSKGINASIDRGLITKGDVLNVLPSKDRVVVKKIKGADLLKIIEYSLSKYPDAEGVFPQVSGIKIIFTQDNTSQNRVLKVWINDLLLEEEKYYLVATNDFLAAGGDGFETFKKAKTIQEGERLDQIFIKYIREKEIIKSKVTGRIIPVSTYKNYFVYEVKKGDSLWKIASKFKVSIDEIAEVNSIKNKRLIYSGQNLLIPNN
ncbi:LysM peptidoglycan-binding domain-containing protein [Iocasia frigidifontis]|uniref:LysM peptidoglycan-binding domain-containing protein n=1 Tax=Iocasia fonsfrigidae TaxID=2682810 RepID=A0A8A7K7B8_9FIRM|nr:LysM peptidoglycan-binding domain-containing protein [Iocasia fonsfrigidae]